MKKGMLCLMVLLSLTATTLFAQQNGGGGQQRQQAMRAYLKDSVSLSDAMVDSVMAIQMQYRPQMRDIFMDQSATDADKQSKMQTLRTEMEGRYKAAGLTDAQIQQIHDREDRMRAQMRNRSGGQ